MDPLSRFERARGVLTATVEYHGNAVGAFRPWVASPTAPNTYAAMRKNWHDTANPYRIWEGGSDRTVYLRPHANHLFRLWHDWLHIAHDLSLATQDELLVAAMHVDAARAGGKDAALLMWIDTTAQTLHYADTGEFVEDQLEFAWGQWLRLL